MLMFFNQYKKGSFFLISPFLVMVLFSVGRGLGNIGLLIYFLAGLFLVSGAVKKKDFGLYVFFLYSILFAGSFLINLSNLSIKSVIVFWLSSLAYLYASSINEYEFGKESKSILISALWIAILSVVFDYMAFFYNSEFRPSTFVNVMVLAVIFPVVFLLDDRRIIIPVLGLISVLIIFSDSRTEVLAVIMSLIFYFCFVFRKIIFMFLGFIFSLVLSLLFIFNSYIYNEE